MKTIIFICLLFLFSCNDNSIPTSAGKKDNVNSGTLTITILFSNGVRERVTCSNITYDSTCGCINLNDLDNESIPLYTINNFIITP